MIIRTGRPQTRENDRELYIQRGDEPDDRDEVLGWIIDPTRAKYLARILNGIDPPFTRRQDGSEAGSQD